MKRILVIAATVTLVTTAMGCGKKAAEPTPAATAATAEPTKAEPVAEPAKAEPVAAEPVAAEPAAAAGGTSIPNSAGLVADVPAGVLPNGVGGAAGFHTEDGSFEFSVSEVQGDDANLTLEAMKAGLDEIMDVAWKRTDVTPDGWIAVYDQPKIGIVDDEAKVVGTVHAFRVRMKINDKVYECTGGLDKAEGIDASIAACKSVRKG